MFNYGTPDLAKKADVSFVNQELTKKLTSNLNEVLEKNALNLIGNRVWVSSEYAYSNKGIVLNFSHNLQLNPETIKKAQITCYAKCIQEDAGFSVGECLTILGGYGNDGAFSALTLPVSFSLGYNGGKLSIPTSGFMAYRGDNALLNYLETGKWNIFFTIHY